MPAADLKAGTQTGILKNHISRRCDSRVTPNVFVILFKKIHFRYKNSYLTDIQLIKQQLREIVESKKLMAVIEKF